MVAIGGGGPSGGRFALHFGAVAAVAGSTVEPRPVVQGVLGGGSVLGFAGPRLEGRCLQSAAV